MTLKKFATAVAVVSLLSVAQTAMAHPGHAGAPASGFSSGVVHPLSGIDHILAMLAVGLCAAQLRGRALWVIPGAFLCCMIAGGVLGQSGRSVPMVEQGIAVSLLVLGLIVAVGSRMGLPAIAALTGLFALFHGYSHGAEMTAGVGLATYALGFTFASGFLIAAGIALGTLLTRLGIPSAARLAGGGIAVAGVVMLFVELFAPSLG